MIEFPFEKHRSKQLGLVYKPIIPLTIVGPRGSANLFMLLDSGADLSLIPYSVGAGIGLELDMNNRSEVQGIGEGSIPYILAQVVFRFGDIEIPARVGWALIQEVPLILGRLDVFRQVSVEFREFEDRIVLRRRGTA